MNNIFVFCLLCLLVFIGIWLDENQKKQKRKREEIPGYIINLDQRKDRIRVTIPSLDKYLYHNVKRFPAVNYRDLKDDEIRSLVDTSELEPIWRNKRTKHHQLSRGAVGCYLSHIRLWEKLRDDPNHDMYLILEDDTDPKLSYPDLKERVRTLPGDWDIYLCGGIYHRNQQINNQVCKVREFFQTHAYVIRKRAVPILLKEAFPIRKQIDSYMSGLSTEHKINVYGDVSSDWKQNIQVSYQTDIQTDMVSPSHFYVTKN